MGRWKGNVLVWVEELGVVVCEGGERLGICGCGREGNGCSCVNECVGEGAVGVVRQDPHLQCASPSAGC